MAKDTLPRLRAPRVDPPFRIVLVEPEIPQNTGNIGRLAAATQSPLHLVGRLGFRTDERAVRRAGLDYWHLVELEQHPSFEDFLARHPDARLRIFSSVATTCYLDADLRAADARAAYELLSTRTQSNLSARAQRYSAASGKMIAPEAMLAPSRFLVRFEPQRYVAKIVGAYALVDVTGLLEGDHAQIACVFEDEVWHVELALPPLAPVQLRPGSGT